MAGFFSVFLAVFLAELGDKTQIASALFAADGARNPWVVFAAASSALVASTALAVGAGAFLRSRLESWPLDLIAGGLFIALGAWMIGRRLLAG
jgi:putative Ca2+/H+ antiporter (TMEM165/GDT1 family)